MVSTRDLPREPVGYSEFQNFQMIMLKLTFSLQPVHSVAATQAAVTDRAFIIRMLSCGPNPTLTTP